MVFFSEKMYWYPQGYAIGELLLFYAFPVYATLWASDFFRVRRLSAVVLIAALYGFLIEGVLTPVMFEGGLLSPFMPAYFVGWHGLLAFVFGWLLLRRWLVTGRWGRILLSSIVVGLAWGAWATTFWLPENQSGYPFPGQWPVADFGRHALTFTLLLAAAHWLLGRGGWLTAFQPSRGERGLLLTALVFFYATLSFPGMPLGLLALLPLLGLIGGVLWLNRRREPAASLLADLDGRVRLGHVACLLAMPAAATAVYAVSRAAAPGDEALRALLELGNLLIMGGGGLAFVWALAATAWPRRRDS